MSNIELDELPKSKEFMKHAKIADGLTKETGLEHGFLFCKPNDEIIVDKMCVGTECSIKVNTEKCQENKNTFHTHPGDEPISDFSATDIYAASWQAHNSNRPNIHCVKSINDERILCQKILLPPDDFALTGLYTLSDVEAKLESETRLSSNAYHVVTDKLKNMMDNINTQEIKYIKQ